MTSGTPKLEVLLIVIRTLPFVGFRFPAFASALTAISLVAGPHGAGIFRAGIKAVPKGQSEGVLALGLHPMFVLFQVLLFQVLLPQAMAIVIPP